MSDLRTQLLSSSVSLYDQKFEAAKKLVMELTTQNNKYSVLVDAEMNPSIIREIAIFEKQNEECQNSMKELSIQLEKVHEKKKISLSQAEVQNKEGKIRKLKKCGRKNHCDISRSIEQQQMTLQPQAPVVKRFEKEPQNNSQKNHYDQEEGVQLQELTLHEPGPELEHIEFDRAIIQDNEHDISQMHGDVITLHKIMSDLATEVDSQGQNLDIIQDLQTKTKKNVIETNKELNSAKVYAKNGTKKYVCFVLCSLITLGIIIAIIYSIKG